MIANRTKQHRFSPLCLVTPRVVRVDGHLDAAVLAPALFLPVGCDRFGLTAAAADESRGRHAKRREVVLGGAPAPFREAAGWRAGRPKTGAAKQLIAIRLSPQLLLRLRRMASRQGKPYQTLIHELLEKAASRAA